MNRHTIIGNIGSDSEVRTLEGGISAISFSVACTEKWKDQQGNKQERTEWVRCTLWRKSDQTSIAQYLKKGTKVLCEGRPSARAWIDQATGESRSALELRVDSFEFLSATPRTESTSSQPVAQQPASQPFSGPTNHMGQPLDPADDLPF